jgi:hypothetical protein
MTLLARNAAVAAVSVLAVALPVQLHAENMLRRADVPDLTAYLPPVNEVPWLKQRTGRPKPLTTVPDAGSLSALLFVPRLVPDWPQPLIQSAEAAPAYIGM